MMTSINRRVALWVRLNSVSIRYKILGLALSLLLLLGFSLTVQMRLIQERTLRDVLQRQGITLARDLAARAADFILLDDLYSLHSLLQDIQANDSSVRYAFILDVQGVPVAYTFADGFPRGLREANDVEPAERFHMQQLSTSEGTVWDIAVPILAGEGGTARLGISEEMLHATVGRTTRQFILTTLLVTVIGLSVALFLTVMITRPIRHLFDAAQAIAAGDFGVRVTPWGNDEIGTLTHTFNQMTIELARAAREREDRDHLRGLLIDKIFTVQEEERRRIARELHDDTGQALTAIKMGLSNAITLCGPCRERGRLDELVTLTGHTLNNVRQLALDIRPPVLDDLGLVAAVRRYISELGRTYPFHISFQAVGMEGVRLDHAAETAVYRIIQEALTNVARHAQARQVDVILERRHNQCVAIIEDDGCGFDAQELQNNRHLGLQGMLERCKLVHGEIAIESAPGQGTTIFVRVPLTMPVTDAETLNLP